MWVHCGAVIFSNTTGPITFSDSSKTDLCAFDCGQLSAIYGLNDDYIIIIHFENVTVFYAKLGSVVCPRVDTS